MSEVKRAVLDPLQQAELLDIPVSDLHLAQIAKDIKNWEEVAPFLGLSDVEEEEIRQDNKEYGVQKRKALQRWREKNGSRATYQKLRNALKHAEERSASSEWKQFRRHLIACGKQTPHPSYEQRPILEMSIYVDLSLVAQDGSDARISNIVRGEGRQVVLIEGPPGSGKTTLTWRVYHQWAEGKFFQQFSLLIPISFSTTGADTTMTCLADILPYSHSKKVRKKVADEIAEKEGKGVCFLIDSWDEVPQSRKWQQSYSYIYNFLKGRVGYGLPHCSIVVTSRPAASSMLRPCATTTLRIAEFDVLKIEEFVERSMDADNASKFCEILEKKSELFALCHLPLNITIAVYLYKLSNHELPSTRTKLYKALVHTQLARHCQLRIPDGEAMDVEISNVMEFLPQEMLTKFNTMCELAYNGIRSGNSLFDHTAIKNAGLYPITQNTLSLMKSVKNVSTATKHSFLHFTIQEYLAAYHITQLKPEQQRQAVEHLLQKSPLSTTLPFYAGLTNLQNEEVNKILLKVMERPTDFNSITEHLVQHVNELGTDPRRLLVALMNCIYESERHELYEQVQPQPEEKGNPSYKQISFSFLYLTPSDCLSIGCFLSHTRTDVRPVLVGCNIKDSAFNLLVHQIIVKEQPQYTPSLCIHLDANPLTHKGFQCLREGLGKRKLSLSFSSFLTPSLYQNAHVNIFKVLTYLIEGLSRSSGTAFLGFGDNKLIAEHKFHLLLLILFSKSLWSLALDANNLRGTMPLLAPTLNHSNLVMLSLKDCNLDDNDMICLGKALQNNFTLMTLSVCGNFASSYAFSEFLMAIQFSAVCTLLYDGKTTVAHMVMLKAINSNCQRADWRPLHLNDWQQTAFRAMQVGRNMASLPQDFVTGGDGTIKF